MLLQDTDSAFRSYFKLYIIIFLVVIGAFVVSLLVRMIAKRRLKAGQAAYEEAALGDKRLRFIRHDIENYSRAYEAGDMSFDGFVEYLVADKVKRAQSREVVLAAEVTPLHVKMSIRQATALLTNLLDNAIEAAENASKAGCANPLVEAVISDRRICIRNSKPADVHPIERDFKTVKEDAASHGMGMSIIREVTETLGGVMEMKDNGDTFETVVSWRDE